MRKIRSYLVGATALTLMAMGLVLAPAASATGPSAGVIFDSIPAPIPNNVPSVGFEATSVSEFGDYATFDTGNANRLLENVDVLMSSWACESGTWHTGDCDTTSGAFFSHPITFTIYENDGGDVGAELASDTETFDIPFRPSADPDCTGGRWEAPSGGCFNGLAKRITFDFSGENVTLPDSVIYSVAYNTTHYGDSPIGESAACYSTPEGCGYDALNVGASSDAPFTGTDDDPDGIFQSSTWGGAYCDNGTGGTGTFRLDTGCWTGSNPHVQFNVSPFGVCDVTMDVPNKTATLQSDCTTDRTIHVLNGWTFDGNGYTITGVDPAGDHFRGAVIQGDAGPDQVTIENLGVAVDSLTNACDADADRLRGILFDGTGGVIRDNEVLGINQGTSGCQEGNGIEVRNAPFTKAGPDKAVVIRDNTADDYQKTGILVNGSVSAVIRNNLVTGAGPVNYIAQNGIQVGFGATARLFDNDVSGNNYTPPKVTACGLLLIKADGVGGQIKSGISYVRAENAFHNNEQNICNFGKGGTFKPVA
jgi:hypothetical protein